MRTYKYWDGLIKCLAVEPTIIRRNICHGSPSTKTTFDVSQHIQAKSIKLTIPTDGIPLKLKDYLELVDWGGREIKQHKRGYIPASAPPILTRDAAPVLDYLARDDLRGFDVMGPVSMLRSFAKSLGRRFIKGHTFGERLCPERL